MANPGGSGAVDTVQERLPWAKPVNQTCFNNILLVPLLVSVIKHPEAAMSWMKGQMASLGQRRHSSWQLWWQECEAAGRAVFTVRKQRDRNTGALPTFSG